VQDLSKSCRVLVLLFCFIIAQSGKILAHFLCKSSILFYFILLQMGEPLYLTVSTISVLYIQLLCDFKYA